jgi:N-acetylmuramoyl-L-alanine amidase
MNRFLSIEVAYRRLICSAGCLLLVLWSAGEAQENALRVEVGGDRGKPTIAGAFQRSGTLYVSLSDLAHILKLSTYENASAGKLEIKHSDYRIKVTRGNPFLIITGSPGAAGHQQSVLQLSREVVYAANSYFLPLDAEATALPLLLHAEVLFDRRVGLLRIGAPPVRSAFDIPTVHLEEKANGTLIRISSAKKLQDIESWLRHDNWLYVTIPDARADTSAINTMRPSGIVKRIVAIQTPTSVQLTFRLSGKIATSELVRDEGSNDVLISVRAEGSEELLKPPPKPEPEPKAERDNAEEHETFRKRWELDVIVLDAGHGGKDWGAIGITGVREKDVALGIALKLGKLLEKNLKGLRVIYTRKDDRFIELDRRGQIANEAGGKLFISIHANSLKRKPSPTQGFEVYLLRPGRTEEAIAIAEQENSVIQYEEGYEQRYKELTDENFILQTMAQSAYMRSSEVFADLAQKELERSTGIRNRGVKQAGFYVLVGASMPNVLVETAYLSNGQDEKFLKSETGQQKFAEALFRAVKHYKDEYEKLLQEGAGTGQ